MGEELSCGKAQKEVKFDFQIKFDLEGQWSPPKFIRILTKVFYIFALHLLILSWTAVELSRRQASDWHTHT